ncbi:MAG: TraR/DksA family transcriptional regulator [Planctomycetota bacterium]|nr:TraR/DksA family transcriptional regulator [Planctomycetota bacterium]
MEKGYSKKEAAEFKKMLLKQREIVRQDMDSIEQETSASSLKEGVGELSNMPVHLADISAESYEQEFAAELLENKGEVAADIENALRKINEGIYGLCEICGKRIKKSRLRVIPYARYCIECQKKREEEEKSSLRSGE